MPRFLPYGKDLRRVNMFFVILVSIFLGSFILLFSVWLVVWSVVMRPKLEQDHSLKYQPFKKI